MGAVSDIDAFRQRLAAAGVDLPAELVELVAMFAGPMVTALDDLTRVDLGGLEPFCPARRLPDDAA